MKQLLMTLIAAFFCTQGFSQTLHQETLSSKKTKRNYNAWVKTMDGEIRSKIHLYQIKNQEIILIPSNLPSIINLKNSPQLNVSLSEIEWMKFRKENRGWRWAWKGALLGLTIGGVTGLVGGDKEVVDCPGNGINLFGSCPTKIVKSETIALRRGFGLGLLAGVTGSLIGGTRIKIPIKGAGNNIEKLKPFLVFQN